MGEVLRSAYLSVCLSVRSHISKSTCPNFTKFSITLPVAVAPWLVPSLKAMQYVMYFRFCGRVTPSDSECTHPPQALCRHYTLLVAPAVDESIGRRKHSSLRIVRRLHNCRIQWQQIARRGRSLRSSLFTKSINQS